MNETGSDQEPRTEPSQGAEISDLIGVKLTLLIALWFAAILVCFFFIGAVAGIIAIIGGAIALIAGLVAVIRRADTTD